MRNHQTHAVPMITIYNLPIVRFLVRFKVLVDQIEQESFAGFHATINFFQMCFSVGYNAHRRDVSYLRSRHEVGFN